MNNAVYEPINLADPPSVKDLEILREKTEALLEGFGDWLCGYPNEDYVKGYTAEIIDWYLNDIYHEGRDLQAKLAEANRENAVLREENTDIGPIYAQLEFAERRLCGMEFKYGEMEEELARERAAHQETHDELKEMREMRDRFAAEIDETRRQAREFKEAHESALETSNRNADIANKARAEATRLRDNLIRAERRLFAIRRALDMAEIASWR